MAADDGALAGVAGAILDGTPVDWASAEAGAAGADADLLSKLRIVSAVADLHRQLPSPTEGQPQWGHLRLLERIGVGAFGEVFRAWDTRLDREVALKLLPPGSASVDARATSIINEGRLLARVRHPNVVTIYAAERIGDRVGLWMEFVKGRTLEQLIQDGRRFTPAEAMQIGVELAGAVAAVHDAGLLHRDIKAQNVMLADDGKVVLMDFGTGLDVMDGGGAALAGTPRYLAPELFAGRDATPASDLYSLGVLLYRVVTGAYPVAADDLPGLRAAHARGARAQVRAVIPDGHKGLARVIDRLLDPDPARRGPTAAALSAECASLLQGWWQRPWVRAVLGAAALALLAAVASLAQNRQPSGAVTSRRLDADPKVQQAYLTARGLIDQRGIENARRAAGLFEEVIGVDPTFAPAWAGRAHAYGEMSMTYDGMSINDALPIIRSSALRALELDSALAEAHAALGLLHTRDFNWDAAVKSYRQAIALDGALTQAATAYVLWVLTPLERFDEAEDVLARARTNDPLSLDVQRELGNLRLVTGRYAEAVSLYQSVLAVDPALPFARLPSALIWAGRPQEAVALLEKAGAGALGYLAHGYVKAGRRAEAERLLAPTRAFPLRLAMVQAALGNAAGVFEALDRMMVTDPHRVPRVLVYPELSLVRGDPRLAALRTRLHLPD